MWFLPLFYTDFQKPIHSTQTLRWMNEKRLLTDVRITEQERNKVQANILFMAFIVMIVRHWRNIV